ncbi:MAG TPA: adenylate/guanylate cyclase domain-containing protein [Anaerolineales bacterium]|nr:adenylate/guanylate cyclase domain-containing protein [Anaerolineales bacterium]
MSENAAADHPYPEERRFATVLFADLQGFTALAEELDFETISDMIKEIWTRLDAVVLKHGGYIDKHIGDEVMAIWGAPYGAEDDAEKAVSCALALVESLRRYCQESPREEAAGLKLKIGLHTGQVLATYLGLRSEYTVIGDTVNTAKRLAEIADPQVVIMGHTTYRMVRGAFRVRRLESLELRGKTQPVTGYVVEEKLEQPTRVRYAGGESLETRMVGRDDAFSDLLDLYEALQAASDPFLGLIIGEAGIGKSRLLMEFESRMGGLDSAVNFFSVRGLSEAEKSPFYVWKSLWKHRFGIHENEQPEIAAERFLRGVLNSWGKRLGSFSAVEAAHVIGALIGLEWKNSPYLAAFQGDILERNRKAFALTRELLGRIAEAGPIILLVDDLHWVDQGSLALLAELLNPAADALPLFVGATVRPQFLVNNFQWLNRAYQTIRLEPIPFTADLIRQAYPKVEHFPDALLTRMADRASGSPFFLEELVKSFIQFDAEGDGRSSAAPLRPKPPSIAHPIPENLRALLQARMDSLPREAREVLQLASVTGRVFWTGAIKAAARQPVGTGLLNLPDEVLDRVITNGLRQIVRAELAFPRTDSIYEGEQEYIFKHQMLQEVAYDTLPQKYLKFYHFAVARWLGERASPGFNAMVARHYEKAGNMSTALRLYQSALDYAENHGVQNEAERIRGHIRNIQQHERK